MLKVVLNVGLIAGLVISTVSCGKDKKSEKEDAGQEAVQPGQRWALSDMTGEWVNAVANLPLEASYEGTSGKQIRVEMTPSYRFTANTLTSVLKCAFYAEGAQKTLEAAAKVEFTPSAQGFVVAEGRSDTTTGMIAEEFVGCGEVEVLKGEYVFIKTGDTILMDGPGEDDELLKRVQKN